MQVMITVTKTEEVVFRSTLTIVILDSDKDSTELANLESTWNFSWHQSGEGRFLGRNGNRFLIIINTNSSESIGSIWDHEWEHLSTIYRDSLKVTKGSDEAFVRAFSWFKSQFRRLELIVKSSQLNSDVYDLAKQLVSSGE